MSRLIPSIAFAVGLILAACSPATAPAERSAPEAAKIEAHMAFLADDALEGREAGTPGYEKAAAYVAEQLASYGLKPAGDDGTWFQQITFRRAVRDADNLGLTVTSLNGTPVEMIENVDYVIGGSTNDSAEITAPAVFVGFGVVAPDLGRDDYAGLDVEGKIVVMLSGTPKGIQSEERAFYGSRKTLFAAERGAIGIVSLETPTRRELNGFPRLIAQRRFDTASMSWLQADGTAYSLAKGIKASSYVSLEGGAKLMQDAPVAWSDILETAEAEGGNVAGFDLPVNITIKQTSVHDVVTSPNVVALLEGSDPELKDEYIVLTAHLDHIGIAKSIEEDRINNGALDNAAGSAILLEAARVLSTGPAPRRSVLFVFVTAEEKGLLGAQYFAKNPTVPKEGLVANVNMDMPIITYDFTDVIVFGANRSTIIDSVQTAASELNVALSPDPVPDEGLFTRSDHFRFVEEGVPSVYLKPGWQNGGEAEFVRHMTTNYHRPSDDMSNTLNFEAGARFADLKARIALALANADARPVWRKDDFFARQFDGPMEP